MGVHALAHGGARRHGTNAKRALVEVVSTKRFNGVKVVLALHQKPQVALEDVAVGNATRTNGELAVNTLADAKAFHILPGQRQTGIGGQIVGQLFDNEVGHVEAHLHGCFYMGAKCLISIGNWDLFNQSITDSGLI